MTQNTTHAVMAQRHEAKDSLDDFPTPPWATRALLTHVIGIDRGRESVWEPACGRGAMLRALNYYFGQSIGTDITSGRDFLKAGSDGFNVYADWIITNPPFRHAEKFAIQGIRFARKGVALLVRTVFLESVGRYNALFRLNPPDTVAIFTERVPMVKGRLDAKASTATSYCWMVWHLPTRHTPKILWIPPCRKQLERPGDYDL